MSRHFLALRGTAEKLGSTSNLLYRAFLESSYSISQYVDVPYDASIGPMNEHKDFFGASLDASLVKGVQVLMATITTIRRKDPDTKIIVTGYSLGCLVALAFVEQYPHVKIDRMILVANPGTKYLLNMGQGRRVKQPFIYEGIVTDYISDKVILDNSLLDKGGDLRGDRIDFYNVNHMWDPIAYLHPKSPLRSIAPWLWALDFNDLPNWFGDIRSEVDRAVFWKWTRFWEPGYADAAGAAVDDLMRYAKTGQHQTAYFEKHWSTMQGTKTIQVSGVNLVGRLADRPFL